jgi:NAD+ diphosphatase
VSPKKLNDQKFCGWCGSEVVYLAEWVSECSSCKHKRYLNPNPCTEVIVQKDDKILLVKRAIQPNKDKFDLPGGFMDMKDESLEQAAYRELQEEIGLSKKDVTPLKFYESDVINYLWQDTWVQNVVLVFHCKLKPSSKPTKLDKSENSEMIWATEQDILKLDFAYEQERELLIKFYKGE